MAIDWKDVEVVGKGGVELLRPGFDARDRFP
jgi:hypothetical protein